MRERAILTMTLLPLTEMSLMQLNLSTFLVKEGPF